MLILNDEEVRETWPREEASQAMEDSYREVAEGLGKIGDHDAVEPRKVILS